MKTSGIVEIEVARATRALFICSELALPGAPKSMTISFGLYLIGFLTKQPFKRSFLTFYVMLGTAVTVLPV